MPVGEFKNQPAHDRFHTVYQDTVDRLWPSSSIDTDVVTSFGTTRVHRLDSAAEARGDETRGDETRGGETRGGETRGDEAPGGETPGGETPFVLLPGSGGPALMWHAYVGRLAASRPVIAIDPVGEPGPSVQTRSIDSGDDWSRWLGEVLAALGVTRAHLVGTSYGGWIALRHALHSPRTTASLALLDPGGFGRVSRKFLLWIIAGGLATFTPRPVRHALARALRNETLRDDDAVRLVKATFGFRRRHILPTPLTDADLERITAPTLLLVGGHSQLYDAREVRDRVAARMPHATAEIVPEASHDLVLRRPEELAERIAAFAAEVSARA